MLHEDMRLFYNGFPRDAHPMAILSSVVGACRRSTRTRSTRTTRSRSRSRSSGCWPSCRRSRRTAYKKSIGQPFIYPQNDLTYCENFLQMMFAVPSEPYEVDPDFVEALNLLLIVHADHEQNCSTSTVRMVGSRNANLFASISAGICALWGPLHGGANEACVEMLEQIRPTAATSKKYVDMAKDKNSNFRLMGFGHRVYKNFDPRATIIKAACDKLLAEAARSTTRSSTSPRSSKKSRCSDPYFIERKLYPNVDFYSGVIYRAIGIPGADVHGAVRHRPPAGLDRPLGRDAQQPDQEDLPPAADLHRADRAAVRADGQAVGAVRHAGDARL